MNWDAFSDISRYVFGGALTIVSIIGGFIHFGEHGQRKKVRLTIYLGSIALLALLFGIFEYIHSKKEDLDNMQSFESIAKQIDSTSKATDESFRRKIAELNKISEDIKYDIYTSKLKQDSQFTHTIFDLKQTNQVAKVASDDIRRTLDGLRLIDSLQAKEYSEVRVLRQELDNSVIKLNQEIASGFGDVIRPLFPLSITYRVTYYFEKHKDSIQQSCFETVISKIDNTTLNGKVKGKKKLTVFTFDSFEDILATNPQFKSLITLINDDNYPLKFYDDTTSFIQKINYSEPERTVTYNYSQTNNALTKTTTLTYKSLFFAKDDISNIDELFSSLIIEIPYISFGRKLEKTPDIKISNLDLSSIKPKVKEFSFDVNPSKVVFEPDLQIRCGNTLTYKIKRALDSLAFSQSSPSEGTALLSGPFEIKLTTTLSRSILMSYQKFIHNPLGFIASSSPIEISYSKSGFPIKKEFVGSPYDINYNYMRVCFP